MSIVFVLYSGATFGQGQWQNIDTLFGPLPSAFHVFRSVAPADGAPNRMFYAVMNLTDSHLIFESDTSLNRRLTPQQYFAKNDNPLLVVNAGFFSFATNANLNAVVKDGKLVAVNDQSLVGKSTDSGYYLHPFYGTFGIFKNNKADVAWTWTNPQAKKIFASQEPVDYLKTRDSLLPKRMVRKISGSKFSRWKVNAAVGGGPVLIQQGEVKITNDAERKFAGKALNDKHPRTAIGYTAGGQLIVFVCEGRSDSAAGLTLPQVAAFMKELGCVEALNLDGGGSTCLLVNGREVNTPSSKGVQRPVPSVFLVRKRG